MIGSAIYVPLFSSADRADLRPAGPPLSSMCVMTTRCCEARAGQRRCVAIFKQRHAAAVVGEFVVAHWVTRCPCPGSRFSPRPSAGRAALVACAGSLRCCRPRGVLMRGIADIMLRLLEVVEEGCRYHRRLYTVRIGC